MPSGGALRICNAALSLLGSGQVQSWDEGTDLAQLCLDIHADTLATLQALHPWKFTIAQAQLARLTAAPLAGWSYLHALPPDSLELRALYPSAGINERPLESYVLAGGRVMSNQIDIWAEYHQARDPDTYPPIFWNLAKTALAGDLAVPVTGSAAMADFHYRRAFGTPGEGGNGGLMAQARTADAQQQPSIQIRSLPLIEARQGGRWRFTR